MDAERKAELQSDLNDDRIAWIRRVAESGGDEIELVTHDDLIGLSRMIAERDALRETVEALEWVGTTVQGGRIAGACPECGATQGGPHELDCAIGCALKRPECKEGGDGANFE